MISSSDSSGEESDYNNDNNKLKINQKYAKQYEEKKRYQELQRNKELLQLDDEGSGSESESSSEDEDANALSTSLDIEIMKTIRSIKNKDPRIYDKSVKFYTQSDEEDSDSSEDDDSKSKSRKSKKQKQTYKDVVREQLLSGNVSNDDDDIDSGYYHKEKGLAYDQEQEDIRQKFLSSAKGSDSESDGDNANNIMILKPKSEAQKAEEESVLKAAIEEVAQITKKDSELEPMDEDFLSNYMIQKKWLEGADLQVGDKSSCRLTEDERLDLEDDEEELYEVDKFESKYNFRFEEEQDQVGNAAGVVVGHARSVEGSLRRVDDKRKKQRAERKERKEKERRIKELELRRLKNLKREELKSRLKQIAEVCGVENLDAEEDDYSVMEKTGNCDNLSNSKQRKGINMDTLEEEWDPEKHEELMKSQFNDDYYDQNDPDFAPGGKYYDPNAEDHVGEGYSAVGGWNEEYDEGEDEYYDKNDEKNIDNDELGNPELDAELYKFDYEDIVAGIPCRFKYQTVESEDYGLTIDDIMDAQDSELNKYVGLKKISASYRQSRKKEQQDMKLSRKRKQLREAIKKRKLGEEEANDDTSAQISTSKDSADIAASSEVNDGSNAKTGKKKRKRNKKKVIGGNLQHEDKLESDGGTLTEENPQQKKKKAKRKKSDEQNGKEDGKKRRMDLFN